MSVADQAAASESAPKPKGLHTSVGAWVGVLSALLTLVLTGLNAYWSREIDQTDQRLKARAAQLEEQRLVLEQGKERMARYEFVQKLFPLVLNEKDPGQRTLSINLINLALLPDEAQQLFAGLQASSDERTQAIGSEGRELVALTSLVSQMNAATKESRIGAVDALIRTYRSDPRAVEQALTLLDRPALDSLSPSGRVNVLVFLKNTDPSAWTAASRSRAGEAIAAMRQRHDSGVAQIGQQTQTAITDLERHISTMP